MEIINIILDTKEKIKVYKFINVEELFRAIGAMQLIKKDINLQFIIKLEIDLKKYNKIGRFNDGGLKVKEFLLNNDIEKKINSLENQYKDFLWRKSLN